MQRKFWIQGLVAGAAVGLAVASVMTFLDWRLNPGGIFHNADSTHWIIVRETALSWFVPVFGIICVLTIPVFYLRTRRK